MSFFGTTFYKCLLYLLTSGLPGVTYSRSPLETQLDALSIASHSGDENGNFVMDPSAVEIFETHARQQCGRLGKKF